MSQELWFLAGTAASIGIVHTVLGPDHYVPFIALSKARKWSVAKTAWVTVLCGLGHVASSVLLGWIGIATGVAVGSLTVLESWRGDLAAWILTGFGTVYLIWGVRAAIRNRPHRHWPSDQHGGKGHPHPQEAGRSVWALFIIFVFGPCEPLIPILMYPAATKSLWGVVLVVLVFGATTISTMMVMVLPITFGLSRVQMEPLQRYGHALAGAMLAFCGMAIHFGL